MISGCVSASGGDSGVSGVFAFAGVGVIEAGLGAVGVGVYSLHMFLSESRVLLHTYCKR